MQTDFKYFRQKRDRTPVWLDPRDNVWNVYRHADVINILTDHRTFSSELKVDSADNKRAEFADGNMLVADPPRHNELRRLVTQAFSPPAIARMEGRIAVIAEKLLDNTNANSHLELISQFAYPLPVSVIAQMLGVPTTHRRRFKAWADAFLDIGLETIDDRVRIDTAGDLIRHFHTYMRDQIAHRRARVRGDLLSDLITARTADRQLSDSEIVGFATLLLLAGHITTVLLLGNVVLCLDEHPEAQEVLRANFSAIAPAIEETLRYRSPVRLTRRVTTRDVEVCGVTIPARQMVNVWLVSANQDERQFDRPDEFVFDRWPNPHVAFGRGIHFCLGAPLARLESTVALSSLLRRYVWFKVDSAQPPEMYPSAFFSGARSLHLVVTPAAARAA